MAKHAHCASTTSPQDKSRHKPHFVADKPHRTHCTEPRCGTSSLHNFHQTLSMILFVSLCQEHGPTVSECKHQQTLCRDITASTMSTLSAWLLRSCGIDLSSSSRVLPAAWSGKFACNPLSARLSGTDRRTLWLASSNGGSVFQKYLILTPRQFRV